MYKGKTNIEIVKSYLEGEKLFPVFGYTPPIIKRNVGDEWTDSHNVTWRQESGYKTRVNAQADIIHAAAEEKCKSCKREIKWGGRADQLFFRKTGLCEGCLIDYETKLRILGIYNDYETYKLASNELGYVKDMKSKIQETIKYFESGDTDVKMLCNSEGFIERWKTTNADQILSDAKKDLEEVHRRITALIRIRDEQKEKYTEACAKYNLEILCQTEKSPIKT